MIGTRESRKQDFVAALVVRERRDPLDRPAEPLVLCYCERKPRPVNGAKLRDWGWEFLAVAQLVR